MAIKRYYATKDNTITNAFKSNLSTRGVSGNMGQSDVLEVFSIYAQANTSSSELGVLVIIALPPVASVGDILVQNSLAILGRTKANSSQYSKLILKPRPVFSVVA